MKVINYTIGFRTVEYKVRTDNGKVLLTNYLKTL